MAPNWQLPTGPEACLYQSPSASSPDSDPLLCFETESSVPPESPQPVVEPRTSARPALVGPLGDRVEALESALAVSNSEVALLRADVATLVRTVDDIRARSRRRSARPSPAPRHDGRIVSLMAGLLVALLVAGWLWMSSRVSAAMIAPPPAIEQLPGLDSAPASVPSAPR